MNRKIEITQQNVQTEAERLAWNRVGFEGGFEAAKDSVRCLSLEEKIELLTEVFIKDLTLAHIKKKRDFLLRLGHKTWVDSTELYEFAKITYTNMEDVEWQIDPHDFYSVEVDMRNANIEMMNTTGLTVREEQRKGNIK